MGKIKKAVLTKNNTALFIALLFHICGAIGILCTPYRQWFINSTPLTLVIMAILAVITQPGKQAGFYGFIVFSFVFGITVELTGVHTGWLFGHYSYGAVLGPTVLGVPWLIGLNWFSIIYCSCTIVGQASNWLQTKLSPAAQLPPVLHWVAFISDAALLATFFDWVLEPVAIKLGFWHWQSDTVPSYNYVCWFLVSLVMVVVFRIFPQGKYNQFAVHLFIIQVLFFGILQTFL